MSDAASDFDVREQIARIDNLREEALKFMVEQRKLTGEALKLRRDRWLAPLLVLVSALGVVGGLLSVLHAAGVF